MMASASRRTTKKQYSREVLVKIPAWDYSFPGKSCRLPILRLKNQENSSTVPALKCSCQKAYTVSQPPAKTNKIIALTFQGLQPGFTHWIARDQDFLTYSWE